MTDAELVVAACNYVDGILEAEDRVPRMPEISEALGVARSCVQRAFRQATGLTPAQYARGKRMERFKGFVRRGASVSESMYEAGYGSSSRLYEQASQQLGMTPASYRKGGSGAIIRYVVARSALGGSWWPGQAGCLCGEAGR